MQFRLGTSSSAKGFRHGLLLSIVVCVASSLAGCAVKVNPVQIVGAVAPGTTASNTGSGSTSSGSSSSGGSSSSTSSSGSTPTSTTPTSTTPTSVASSTGFQSMTNFGDSITCGYYALPNDGAGYMYSTAGYATLLDTQVGVASKDLCRGGDMAADMARLWVYPNAESGLGLGQLYSVLIGTNDAHFCGGSDGCLANWSQSLAASLAWLALPGSDKILGEAMSATQGAWQSDMEYGQATSHNGATLSFDVNQAVAGRLLHVAYRVWDAAVLGGGTAVVSVDGIPMGTVSAVSAGHAIATQNGTTDTVFLADLPLGAAGQHSVTITTTSPEGAMFSVLWAGTSTQNYAAVNGAPTVMVGQITPTGNNDLNTVVAQYNAAMGTLVVKLAAEGMNVVLAPTATAFDPATEMSDMLHPNNVGHAKVAAVFAGVVSKLGS